MPLLGKVKFLCSYVVDILYLVSTMPTPQHKIRKTDKAKYGADKIFVLTDLVKKIHFGSQWPMVSSQQMAADTV